MDKITFTPSSIRGGGDILDTREVSDFILVNSTITDSTQTVLGDVCTVFNLDYSAIDVFSAFMAELNNKNVTSLVKDLSFTNNSIVYTPLLVSNIDSVDDLVGVVYNIQFDSTNNCITYDSFTSDTDFNALETALTSITYNSTTYQLLYEILGELNV